MLIIKQIDHPKGVKCGTFGASNGAQTFSFGDFDGKINIVDLESKKVTSFYWLYS